MTQFIPPVALGGTGYTYSDDGTGTYDMLAGGHRTNFLPMLNEVVTLANSALNSANSAVGSANATGTSTTSISTPTIGSDTATITTQSGKVWVAGMTVIIANSSAPYTQWLTGFVKTYSGTSLVVTVSDYGGTAAWPGTSWTISAGSLPRPALVTYSAQTAASITLVVGDRGKLIDYTGTTSPTINFPAAATAGAGWYVYIRNGTAIAAGYSVTLDPNSTETIDGLTTFKMYPGETRLVTCTGSAWISIVLTPYTLISTSSFTWTKPPGYRTHRVKLWGGGASGGGGRGSVTGTGGSAGGGGVVVEDLFNDADLSATESVTVGAAQTSVGTGGNGADGTAGSNGNSSQFKSLVALGGSAGAKGYTGAVGASSGAGGLLMAGLDATGTAALTGASQTTSSTPAAGKPGVYSGGGGISGSSATGGAGGDAIYGGAGGGAGGGYDGTARAGGSGGTTKRSTTTYTGAGGAGGAANAAGVGTVGSNGAIPGGGGGGGGFGSTIGGNGGQGAAGMAWMAGNM